MVALPLRGELQHWKKMCGERAMRRTNGYHLKTSRNFNACTLRRKIPQAACGFLKNQPR
jgi:hypothetical protein